MLYALLAHVTLLTIAILRRNGGQSVSASLLLANWALNSAFVSASGCDFPWAWYLTIDWLTAVVLWLDKQTVWQRLLIGSYAAELTMHAAFAYVTRNDDAVYWSHTSARLYWTQWWYWKTLSTVEWGQTILVGGWIGYDMARNYISHVRRNTPSASSICEAAK